MYNTPEKQAQADTFPLEDWAAEMRLTQQTCERLRSPVVWCHIDLLSGNILVDKKVSPSFLEHSRVLLVALPCRNECPKHYMTCEAPCADRSRACGVWWEWCPAYNSLTSSTAPTRRAASTGATISRSMPASSAHMSATLTPRMWLILCAPTWQRGHQTSRCARPAAVTHVLCCHGASLLAVGTCLLGALADCRQRSLCLLVHDI